MAEEHRKGRRLFIGTTSLDANRFTVFNMGEIAIGGWAAFWLSQRVAACAF